MQFDAQRAFPYPVLRPEVDDYVDGEFQTSVEFSQSQDMQDITLEVEFTLSVPEIMACIEKGQAEFVIVVSCRETFYRQRFATESSQIKVSLPAGHVRGEVETLPYVVAKEPITGYQSGLINPEFGNGPFSFEQAAVLAVDRPRQIFIDREAFKPVSSVFELVQNVNVAEHEWVLGFTNNKVQIQMHPSMKQKIDNYRVDRKNKAVLINSIYSSAVMQCIAILKSESEDFDDCRWSIIIRQQCDLLNIDLKNEDEYRITQKLLRFPLTVFDAYLLNGVSE